MLVATRRNRIAEILDEKGWSIYKLAKEAKISYRSLHTLVNNEAIPDRTYYSTLRTIAEVLDVSIDDLEEEVD